MPTIPSRASSSNASVPCPSITPVVSHSYQTRARSRAQATSPTWGQNIQSTFAHQANTELPSISVLSTSRTSFGSGISLPSSVRLLRSSASSHCPIPTDSAAAPKSPPVQPPRAKRPRTADPRQTRDTSSSLDSPSLGGSEAEDEEPGTGSVGGDQGDDDEDDQNSCNDTNTFTTEGSSTDTPQPTNPRNPTWYTRIQTIYTCLSSSPQVNETPSFIS